MNPSVNRSSESPQFSGQTKPETNQAETVTSTNEGTNSPVDKNPSQRQQPIPPPSHPRQYRAIGLIQGQYQRSPEYLNRGILVTKEACEIETVILGKAISLVKKHLDLEKSHLWVVYPRTRPDNDQFHLQIIGVWEPSTLSQESEPPLESPDNANIRHGYFSVRGEVIFADSEQEKVIVKIRQSPKQEEDKPKFFKLKLKGILPERPVSRFWDFQVQLQGDVLVIDEYTDLGLIQKKPSHKKKKPFRPVRKEQTRSDHNRPIPKSKRPLPKRQSLDRQSPPN